MPERYVIFSHGKDGEPWSRKISGMADIARAEGYRADSLDYRGIDSPRERITKLVAHCQKLPGRRLTLRDVPATAAAAQRD